MPVDPHLPALKPQLTSPKLGSLYSNPSLPTFRSRKPSPGGLVFGFPPKFPHPCTLVNPHLLALKPHLTPPQLGPLYPNTSPPTFRSCKLSPSGLVFSFPPRTCCATCPSICPSCHAAHLSIPSVHLLLPSINLPLIILPSLPSFLTKFLSQFSSNLPPP